MDTPPQGGAPGLKLLPHRRTPLYFNALNKARSAGPSGTSTQRFGVWTAWNTDKDLRRLLVTHHLRSAFEFSIR